MPHPSDGHAGHDQLLVAAYAAGDATGRDLDTATTLVATCDQCAALHRDLRSIAAATAALPAPARSRDFRLAPEQAASLRPAGWRRWLAPFAGHRFALAGPLGGGLAALGVAGILLAGGVGLPMGGASSALSTVGAAVEQPEAAGMASAAPAEMPAMEAAPATGDANSGAGASGGTDLFAAPQAGASAKTDGDTAGEISTTDTTGDPAARSLATAPTDTSPASAISLGLLAGVLLIAGMVLGGLRLGARFVTRPPG